MALIHNNRPFDPDAIPSPVVGIALDAHQHDSGMHQHRKGQLLYAPSGCINFAFEQSISILPPTRAVWIPANTPHQAVMTKVVAYRSLYFDATEFQCPQQVRTIKVNALLKALINKMALWEWDTEPQQMRNTNALFWEEFNQAPAYDLQLTLPSNRRFRDLKKQLMDEAYLLPTLTQMAQKIGASSKTISRLFKAETGMSYQQWRQQWRLLKSIKLLSQGLAVIDVAHQLGFSSDSAFIASFKKLTGQTPLAFINSSGG